MPRYMLLLYRPAEFTEEDARERADELPVWQELWLNLRDAGLLVDSGQLEGTHAATSLRVRDGQAEVTDGPFATTKEILAGMRALERSVRLAGPGPFQLQAAIAALHGAEDGPDWPRIAELYGALARLRPSPVVAVNHAAAVGFAAGPRAGLEALAPLLADPRLASYQPLHAAHADLLRRAGETGAASAAYRRAIGLSGNAVERAELQRRLSRLPARA